MGSGNSKLNPEGEAMPAKLRPIVHRWFEEIRKRKNADMSKKELLKDAVEEDESSGPHSLHDRERESTSSSHGSHVASSKQTPDVVEEKSDAAPRPSESNKTSKEPKPHKDEEICGKQDEKEDNAVEKAVVIEEVVAVVEDQETMEEEEDEEEDETDAYVCPGSPSFRVYCVQSTEDNKEESEKGSMHKNSPSGDSAESNSDEGQETKTKKKGNKARRRLTRAIRKGGPAVKNLLNVASCYHPSCSGQDRARLLEEKAEA